MYEFRGFAAIGRAGASLERDFRKSAKFSDAPVTSGYGPELSVKRLSLLAFRRVRGAAVLWHGSLEP